MSNLYPPILESQRDSIPGIPIAEQTFNIPFTMPLTTVPAEIGHVQVMIKRQKNLDPWVNRNHKNTPDSEVIYLPGFKTGQDSFGPNCLEDLGGGLWQVKVPKEFIRGMTSIQTGGDNGSRGFSAGYPEPNGEMYLIQVRFGDNPLTYQEKSKFYAWKKEQVAAAAFGEWSNTQRMFCYGVKQGQTSVESLFNVAVAEDPIAKIKWDYRPVSVDPLAQVRISYSWTTPDNYGNSFNSKNLPFVSNDGRGASSSGEVDLGIMRLNPIIVTLQFITVNQTRYTWVADLNNKKMGVFPFQGDPTAKGAIAQYPIVGEEMEDGVIGVSLSWKWRSASEYYKIYRVEVSTLETILLATLRAPSNASTNPLFSTVVKDYSVEMGTGYLYIAARYNKDDICNTVLLWEDNGPLSVQGWDPFKYSGYIKQSNFQGNIFLTTKWQQLRLQGDISVSRLQRNTSDQFTTTVGGKYPFYTRASNFNYRTISLQALISLNFDTTNTFLRFKAPEAAQAIRDQLDAAVQRYQDDIANYPKDSRDRRIVERQAQYYAELSDIYRGKDPLTGKMFIDPKTQPFWLNGQFWMKEGEETEKMILRAKELYHEAMISPNIKRINYHGAESFSRVTDNLTAVQGPTTVFSYNKLRDITEVRDSHEYQDQLIYAERKFREAVMEWLSDGKPKLMRSETEGNMIVMVTGASFTPHNKRRQLYTVSINLTEIAEYNLGNLILYGLVPANFTSFYIPDMGVGIIEGDPEEDMFFKDKQYKMGDKIRYTFDIIVNGVPIPERRKYRAKSNPGINNPPKSPDGDNIWEVIDE